MKIRTVLFATAMAMAAGQISAQTLQLTLQLSHGAAPGNPRDVASQKFAALVDKMSDGQLKVDVGGNAQFGDDAETITNLRLGTVAFAANSQGTTSAVVPQIALLGLPFLFKCLPQANAVMDGPVGDEIAKDAEKQGLVVLAWWNNGIREVSNSSKPIKTPADLVGMKIRTPPDPMTIDIFNALGASPTPMNFSELYVALQQGVVDGQENPLINIYSSKLYEVQPYISMTNHKFEATPFLASKAVFDSLSAKDQKIIREAAIEAGKINRKMVADQTADLRRELEEKGTKINDVDAAPFVKATQPVYDKWHKKYPRLVDGIVAASSKAADQCH